MTTIAPKIDSAPVAEKDAAESFAESDVTLSGSAIETLDGSVHINDQSTVSKTDTDDIGEVEQGGLIINPNYPVSEVTFTVFSSNPTVDNGAVIVDQSDGTTVASTSQSIAGGDTITLSASLSAGQDYAIYLRNSSTMYYRGDKSVTFPFGSAMADVVDGWANRAYSEWLAFSEISFVGDISSATATVEWPYPPDVYAWDVGVYQTSGAGTIEVYVEEEQSGGWTEIAGPIKRGDSLPADPSNNIRYRVELSRTSTSDDPSLDAIYRRRKL